MLAKAPDRSNLSMNSLPYRSGSCNTRNPEKSQSRARCASRLAVMTDARLPMGARVLYALLDDYAGAKGTAWPKQQTLAHRLGASRQRVNAWLGDLERLGWVAVERTGRANRYTLKWATPRTSERATCGQRIPIPQPVVMEQPEVAPAEAEPEEAAERGGPCHHCQDTGEREYRVPASIGAYGARIPERRWRGKCGCRVMIRSDAYGN